jgi:hypothetical protein
MHLVYRALQGDMIPDQVRMPIQHSIFYTPFFVDVPYLPYVYSRIADLSAE